MEKYLKEKVTRNKAEAQKELSRVEVVERWKALGEPEKEVVNLNERQKQIQGIKPPPNEPPEEPFKGTHF